MTTTERSKNEARRIRAVEAITTITADVAEGEAERRLSLSRGYLSRVRSGAIPGDLVFALLVLVARSPRRRLAELAAAMPQNGEVSRG